MTLGALVTPGGPLRKRRIPFAPTRKRITRPRPQIPVFPPLELIPVTPPRTRAAKRTQKLSESLSCMPLFELVVEVIAAHASFDFSHDRSGTTLFVCLCLMQTSKECRRRVVDGLGTTRLSLGRQPRPLVMANFDGIMTLLKKSCVSLLEETCLDCREVWHIKCLDNPRLTGNFDCPGNLIEFSTQARASSSS